MTDETTSDDLYAAVDGAAYPLSNDEVVFRTRAGGEKHVMTLEVLQALDACSRFRPFEQHVRSVTQTLGQLQGQEEGVRRLLGSARRQGLFVSAADLLASPAAAPPADPEGPVPVFIRAGEDGARLAPLLDGARRLEAETGRCHRYYVVEAGDDEDARKRLHGVVARAAGEGLDCRLLDRPWQNSFIDNTLDAAGLAGDAALRTALAGEPGEAHGAGRLRNLVQLLAAGEPHLMLDDAVGLSVRRDPGAPGGVALDAGDWELWFAADGGAALGWGEPAALDPLFEHYRALGLNGLQALRRYGGDAGQLAGLDNRRVQRAANAGVLATASGIRGDAADTSHIGYFTAGGASRQRLCASDEDYRQFRATRHLARVRARHCLQSQAAPSPVAGAGAGLLSPTLHVGEGEGLFFARALGVLNPGGRTLEFPWTVAYAPDRAQWPALAWETPFTGNLARFLAHEIAGLEGQSPEVAGAARYRLVAERLGSLAAAPDAELLDRVLEFQLAQRVLRIQALQQVLSRVTRRLPAWERDVRAIIQVNGQSLEQGVPRRLADMPEGLDAPGAAHWIRRRVEPLHRALAAWPRLWEAARQAPALAATDAQSTSP